MTTTECALSEDAARRVGLIVAVGIAARLLLLMVVDPSQGTFSGDSASYAAEAQRIWSGLPPSAQRAPLYGFFLAATLPFGWWWPLVVQSAMTIASGLLAFSRGHFCAGLLIASCPFLALMDFRLLSESLYINLLFYAWFARGRILPGVLLGLAILTRDTLLLLPIFALLILRTKAAMRMTVIAYVISLPWFITHDSGRMGLNLWAGTWARNGDWYLHGLKNPEFPSYAFQSPSEENLIRSTWPDDRVLMRVAILRIRDDPLAVAETWATRYWRLWLGTRSDQIAFRLPPQSLGWTVEKSAFWLINLLTLMFGLWGMRKPDRSAIPILYVALIYIPFHNVETRYSLMAFPFLLWLGSRRHCLDYREAERQRFAQRPAALVLDRDLEEPVRHPAHPIAIADVRPRA
jgi:hypothetical protein